MSNLKLEYLRNLINSMLESEDYDPEELLNKSRELDLLILNEMREKYPIEDKSSIQVELSTFNCVIESLTKMYDSMRLVNPVSKEVIGLIQGKLKEKDMTCYSFWEKDQFCDNCISLKAFNEDKSIFKLEVNEERIYLVFAVPLVIHDRKLVAEFIKEVDNLFVQNKSSWLGLAE